VHYKFHNDDDDDYDDDGGETGCFRNHQQTTGEGNARNTEKWGLSVLKHHDFVIFRYISTKLGGKVDIFLFRSCVKFHVKNCTHC